MVIFGQPSQPLVDQRGAAFARLASRILSTLNAAADLRKAEGRTLSDAADKLGWHRSALSRILNGTKSNVTLRSISDILWAFDFEPKDFGADPLEEINSNAPAFIDYRHPGCVTFISATMNISDYEDISTTSSMTYEKSRTYAL